MEVKEHIDTDNKSPDSKEELTEIYHPEQSKEEEKKKEDALEQSEKEEENKENIPEQSRGEEEETKETIPESPKEEGVNEKMSVGENEENSTEGSEEHPNDEAGGSQLKGAAIACGIAGFACGGVVGGVLAGAGAAYASTRNGAVGDVARAVGDVALVAGKKAKDIDEKHHVVEKTKEMAGSGWEKAKGMDQKTHILQKSESVTLSIIERVKEFHRRHQIIARTRRAFAGIFHFLAKKIKGEPEVVHLYNKEEITSEKGEMTTQS